MKKDNPDNPKARAAARRRTAGFTLIEVLLVVVILGILAAVVVPKLAGRIRPSEVSAARASIMGIETALDLYEVDNGGYPASLNNLIQSAGEPNWNGPYFKSGRLPIDPWGTPFGYTVKDNGYEIRSAGPDRQMGSADDITN